MKYIIKLIRKIIFSFLLLYKYNLIGVSYNLIVPINIYTIGLLTFLDGPGLILLVAIYKLFYWG